MLGQGDSKVTVASIVYRNTDIQIRRGSPLPSRALSKIPRPSPACLSAPLSIFLFFESLKFSFLRPLTGKPQRENLLVDPGGLGRGPLEDLLRLEPERDLLLGVLDAVGAVADVAADVDGEVAADGAGGGGEGVGGAEEGCDAVGQ